MNLCVNLCVNLICRFPQFQDNDFFIAGESYAGIYVPNLAKKVVEGNEDGVSPFINIVGIMVGNGVTDKEVDLDAFVPFAAGKSLISREHAKALDAACNGVFWNRTAGTECARLYGELFAYKCCAPSSSGKYHRMASCGLQERWRALYRP